MTQDQRPHAQWIAHANQLGLCHGNDGKRPFNAAQRIFHPLRDVLLEAAGHEVNNAFAVRGGLENRPASNQFFAQRIGIGNIAIMRNRRAAHGKLTEKRLHIAHRRVALGSGGRIAHMSDRQIARQLLHDFCTGEIVAHIAKATNRIEAEGFIMGDNAASLLAAMLQSM